MCQIFQAPFQSFSETFKRDLHSSATSWHFHSPSLPPLIKKSEQETKQKRKEIKNKKSLAKNPRRILLDVLLLNERHVTHAPRQLNLKVTDAE